MKKAIKKILTPFIRKYDKYKNEVELNRILLGKIYFDLLNTKNSSSAKTITDYEFRVFSQSGEDGIIQYLISQVPIKNDTFVEFGVEDYSEANTRFLLQNNNWKGLIIDGNSDNIESIKSRDLYWRYELTAVSSFITRENINDIIKSAGISGDIGLLSIDVDGNDYWIWETINVISPRIVICEYNSILGNKEAVSVPYDPSFYRNAKHYSNLFFGASLKALCFLAEKKNYHFVGCSLSGANAFFVRKDVSGNIKPVNCNEGYVKSRARESRDKEGNLTYISGDARVKIIGEMDVVDVITGEVKKVNNLELY
jgi:hypothetical protein